jgi:hypothetical protein
LKNCPFASNFALKCMRLLLLYEARVRKHSKYCKMQRRLDSRRRPQSIMGIERLIPRVTSLTVDCRGVNIYLTKAIWKLLQECQAMILCEKKQHVNVKTSAVFKVGILQCITVIVLFYSQISALLFLLLYCNFINTLYKIMASYLCL